MPNPSYILPVLMLVASNVFMTFAWYGHLKFKSTGLITVILISWGIAFVEYCLMVPANRIGFASGWSGGQLKVVQEAITLVVFGGFAVMVLGEPLGWRHLGAFVCLMGAVGFLFLGK